jgi:hypothetical protein
MVYNNEGRPSYVRLCARTGYAGQHVSVENLRRAAGWLRDKCDGLARIFMRLSPDE